jgi:hypothetical protein
MNTILKKYFFSFFLFSTCFGFAQTDTTQFHGTIKVVKPKEDKIYIKVTAEYGKYDFSDVKFQNVRENVFQPFPVVEGFAYPFNYTGYFNKEFSTKEIDLKGKAADTVTIEIKVLAKGKVYIKDKTPLMMMNGVPAFYNEQVGGYELNNLHLNCLTFLKKIKTWFPAYVMLPKKEKFKNQTVLKPSKKKIDSTGTITIFFSTTPFPD